MNVEKEGNELPITSSVLFHSPAFHEIMITIFYSSGFTFNAIFFFKQKLMIFVIVNNVFSDKNGYLTFKERKKLVRFFSEQK